MLLRRIIYLAALVACVIFYAAYQQWFSFFLLVAMLGLPLFSLLLSLFPMLTARAVLNTPKSTTIGTMQYLDEDCVGLLPPPPWQCKVVVERPLTQESWVKEDGDALPTEHCGALNCTIEKAWVCDYLGLFRLPLQKSSPRRILVRPRPIPMELYTLQKFTVRAWRPKWGGGFAENHELRKYHPGDSVRQIHWKLSAKTGSYILRQPMEPIQDRLQVRMDLRGTPAELDRKLGRLLWLGDKLLDKDLQFDLHVLTGQGIQKWHIADPDTFRKVIDALLVCTPAPSSSSENRTTYSQWQYYIGGEADEAS